MTPAIALLEARGIAFGIHEYDRGDELTDFGREAADALGLDHERVFKTLLVDVIGGSEQSGSRGAATVVAVVPVSCLVSMKLLAAAVGAKRATMCDPAVAERLTGYVVGGISPLGQRQRLPTVLDETVELFDTIFVSGGKRGLDISVAPDALCAVLDATVAPITA